MSNDLELLVDSGAFWDRLRRDIGQARHRVYVQAMTFEADRTGNAVARHLSASGAADKRLLIDEYSRHIVSDKLARAPRYRGDHDLQRELRDTRRLDEALRQHDVRVRFVNPVGPLLVRFPFRNHKKLIIVDDDVAYFGGINFSDHNFAWHDLMYRSSRPELVAFLRDDVLATWQGNNQRASAAWPGIRLHILDGQDNPKVFEPILAAMASARRRVFVECPYLTFPFIDALREAKARGAEVTVVTSAVNNWAHYRDYMPWELARSGVEVRYLRDRFTHLKTILIDDTKLYVGSANYDIFSYWAQQELIAEIDDADAINEFRALVVQKDLDDSHAATDGVRPVLGRLRRAELRLLGRAMRVLRHL
ncbi:MAG: phosphatidylserine/phosphatidylglycerophosphate/cardiolipin synthase family protein [Proteobacteria bacterium]|nr:phosphatidylserine/phosphatidylglycerophosphate/cardiolipin synthase family protein [Pseudomonadota bacterium]